MKYMGSKNRYAKFLLPIILKSAKKGQCYVEPFAGGMNMIDKVDMTCRVAHDTNTYLITMFEQLVYHDWKPPISVTEKEYNELKQLALESSVTDPKIIALIGYVGFNSYGGKFFRGYRRDKEGKRDYWKEHYNNIMKQIPSLMGTLFFNLSYDELEIPEKSIIYCDPPYQGTEKYKKNNIYVGFDYDKFWQWVRDKKSQGNKIYVSEYTAPKDFKVVWQKEVSNNLTTTSTDKKAVEKLFTL